MTQSSICSDYNIVKLFVEFDASSSFPGDKNLIEALFDAFEYVEQIGVFDGIGKFENMHKELIRLKKYSENHELRTIKRSASSSNAFLNLDLTPISAALTESIHEGVQSVLPAIMILRVILVFAVTGKISPNIDTSLVEAATELRLATAEKSFEKRKEDLGRFTREISKLTGINALLTRISLLKDELASTASRKLFRKYDELQPINLGESKKYILLGNALVFDVNEEQQNINIIKTNKLDDVYGDDIEGELDIPTNEPVEQVELLGIEDIEADIYIKECLGDGEVTEEIKQDLVDLKESNNQRSETKAGHWQYHRKSFLPTSTSLFNRIERRWLGDRIIKMAEENPRCALITLLSICLSKEVEEVLSIKVGEDEELTYEGVFKKVISKPENSVVPKSSVLKMYAEHTDIINLPLPWLVKKILNNEQVVVKHGNLNLGERIGWLGNEAQENLDDLLGYLRVNYSSRFTKPRIRNQVKLYVLSKEKDVALGFILFGSEKYSAPMPNYYRSFSVEVVIEKYRRYCNEYFHNWEQSVE